MLCAHLVVRRLAPLSDPWLLPCAALLCGLGISLIYRLDPSNASRQTLWLVVGVALMLAVLYFLPDHEVLERYKYVIGAGSVFVLLLLFSPFGENVRGARLWLDFGGPFRIQPGEFTKVGIVIFLAAYLRENRELLSMKFSPKHLGPLLLFWMLSLGLLVLVNDFGTSLLFFGTFLLLVYVATGRLWYVFGGLVSFIGGSAIVYRIAPHVKSRFDVWLDPWTDEQGAGYQLAQGLYALADGGVFGRGLGQAYLVTDSGTTLIPDAHTDYIFAVAGDELGFVGAAALLTLFIVFAWRGFAIAARCHDGFSKLLAFGLAAVFALQTIIIIGGVVRLLPLTGQTLPFVSYGGSSVLVNFIVVALLLRISHRANERTLELGALA
jgi:cell division protein FtsW (lipid II flippase)